MSLEELRLFSMEIRNKIVSYNNIINGNYLDIDNKLRELKTRGVKITKDIISLVLATSLVFGSATYIGVSTHKERVKKLESSEYSTQEFNKKRGIDYLTAYFGYVLLLIVINNGIYYFKGSGVFTEFFEGLKSNVKKFKSGINDGTILFRDMRENVMYLYSYLLQFEEIKISINDIINDNPCLKEEELIIKIEDILNSIDIDDIRDNAKEKIKILG